MAGLRGPRLARLLTFGNGDRQPERRAAGVRRLRRDVAAALASAGTPARVVPARRSSR